jgi:hypothetical protein
MGPVNIEFWKSPRKGKKYRVEFEYKGKRHKIDFGALGYDQYRDSTPDKIYRHRDHKDKERKKRYYSRHGKTKDPLTAKYWANKYLWT